MAKQAKAAEDTLFLHAALEGLELQKQRIEEQIRQVKSRLGNRAASTEPAVKKSASKRKPLSPAARKRIATAQKKRWEAFRKSGGAPQ